MSYSRADISEESFPAWSTPIGNVGIENFQHDKFSGSVTYSIPLQLPHGTNGMQPNLVLRYFSGNGNSSVGVGWNIDMGRITRSTRLGKPNYNDNDIFILQLNDTASELTSIGGGQFRTKIESFLRITKSGNFWLVEDHDGTKYEYGYSVNDLNYYLTKITDTHGNYIEISYSSGDSIGYPQTITYTKGNGLTGFCSVEFIYETRNDNYVDNAAGKTVKFTKRVDYIDIKVEGRLYKRYDLTYAYGQNSGRSLLTQIDEVGKDGSSRLMLAKFSYFNNTVSFGSPQTLANPSPWDIVYDQYVRFGDVNGDNFPDLIKIDPVLNPSIKVALGTGSGWSAVKEYRMTSLDFTTQLNDVQLGDVNGDGKDDIIRSKYIVSGPMYYVAYNNGNGWDPPVAVQNTSTWKRDDYYLLNNVQLAYVNNDKYIDIIRASFDIYRQTTTPVDIYICYGNGQGWNDPVKVLSNLPYNFGIGTIPVSFQPAFRIGNSRLADINGDGLPDILSSVWNTQTNERKFYYMLANGTSWDGVIRENSGATEIFTMGWTSTKIFDVNKDGLPDLLSGRKYNNELIYKYHLGNGNGFGQERILSSKPPWWSIAREVYFADFDKDGIVDCLNVKENKFVSCKLDSPQDELLKEVVTRYGGKNSFQYSTPNKVGDTVFPFSLAILASCVSDPGVSASPSGKTSYYYQGGLYDTQNRIFKGFRHLQTTDPLGHISHTYFHQSDSLLGKIEKDESPITVILNTFMSDSSAPYFTPVIQVDEYTDSKCSRTTYEYDGFGNMIKETSFGDIDITGDEKSILTDYAINSSSWIINLPSRTRIFANAGASGSSVAENQYFYDNNANYTDAPTKGDLTKVKKYMDTKTTYIQTTSSYDVFGNEVTKTDANGKTTNIVYDSTYHSFPVTITNPKGHVERIYYYMPPDTKGLFGQLKSKVDSNSIETLFEYDVFGRRTKVIGPYDASSAYGSESYEYGINGPGANYILTRTTEESGTANHLIKIDILDGFEKVIQSAREAEDANVYSIITTSYNPRGEIEKTSLPYFIGGGLHISYLIPDSSVKWTQYLYDAIGRISQTIKPDSGTISNYYSGWTTTVTDENIHPKTIVKDAYGRLTNVIEKKGVVEYTTTYEYDALDNLIRITDHLGNKFEYFYDSLKRRIKTIDPDLGTWAYDYDNNANLIKSINANGEIINYNYDELNRMTSKDYASTTGTEVIYSYDELTSTYGVGRRTRMLDFSGASKWNYDKEGRIIKLEKTINSNAYTLEWIYDAMDRVKSVTLPNLKKIDFTYNNAGLAERIEGYVTDADYNAMQQLTSIAFSNPAVTLFDYYPENQRLKTITTGSLQNLYYEYDKAGNITKIADYAHSVLKNYSYDELDRLLSGDGNIYEYNPVGNLVRINNVEQGYSLSKPHALINDGANNYSYDNCGNMIAGAGRSIVYDSENRPIRITKNGITSVFVYDGDGKRVKKMVTEGSTVVTTIYIEDLYEKEFTN